MWSRHFTPGYLSKRKKNLYPYKDLYTNVHSRFICNSRKPETKLWYICTMAYDSAIGRNELLIHAITWMNLKIIMLCKGSQPKKHDSNYIQNSRKYKLICWDRKQISVLEKKRGKKKRVQKVTRHPLRNEEQSVVYPYNGIRFSLKKEGNSDTCYNMDKPWGHYPKCDKPVTKGQIL